ncbi:MAG: glycosyl hydrolase [Bacteroidetes bacterium]|nr:MAG: glycosyl hydrolase [Bacteroidota bacterium]
MRNLLNSFIYLALSYGFLNNTVIAQEQYEIPLNVTIGRTKTLVGFQPCEPSIAVSQKDPDIIVAGSILDNVYRSKDGGLTWTSKTLKSPFGVFGDPCVVSSPNGDFYYFHLSDPEGKGWRSELLLDRIVCQHSSSKGKRWSKGGSIGLDHPKDQDKEWAVVSPDGKRIHACWTQFDKYNSHEEGDSTIILCSFAERNGDNWSPPVRISEKSGNCLDGDATTEGAVPSMGPNGELYVAWALNETIWFDRSMDGGETWLTHDIDASDIIGGWDQNVEFIGRVNGMPVTGVDVSTASKYYGRIYINWTDERNGESDLDVFVCYSDDNGDSWSEPIRVNNDGPGKQQFFTWMSVDPINGGVHVVFYDRRNHDDSSTDVYVASSFDGGISWTNRLVSESPFNPEGKVFFGDYNNISAVNGRIRPIWTREVDGYLTIKTAILDLQDTTE